MCIRDRYGDLLCALRNQTAPYENEPGAADRLVDLWVERLGRVLLAEMCIRDSPMTKQFSYIQGLQPSYTLVYSMDPAGPGECWLTLCRTGCHLSLIHISGHPPWRGHGYVLPKRYPERFCPR